MGLPPRKLKALYEASEPLSKGRLALKDRESFRERYIKSGLEAGLIEMTIPDKPNSRLQQYRLEGVQNSVSTENRY